MWRKRVLSCSLCDAALCGPLYFHSPCSSDISCSLAVAFCPVPLARCIFSSSFTRVLPIPCCLSPSLFTHHRVPGSPVTLLCLFSSLFIVLHSLGSFFPVPVLLLTVTDPPCAPPPPSPSLLHPFSSASRQAPRRMQHPLPQQAVSPQHSHHP